MGRNDVHPASPIRLKTDVTAPMASGETATVTQTVTVQSCTIDRKSLNVSSLNSCAEVPLALDALRPYLVALLQEGLTAKTSKLTSNIRSGTTIESLVSNLGLSSLPVSYAG